MIDPHRLLILRDVARAGSFTQAAAALRQTPSAISQQIAALERTAGVTVVNRSTRGVTLTDAGRVLLAAADAIHAEIHTVSRHIDELKANGPRTLTVATFPSAGESLLAPALSRLTHASHTGAQHVDITVIEAEPEDALTSLRNGDVDVALVYHFHSAEPPGEWQRAAGAAAYTPLIDDQLRLVVPKGHRLAARERPVTLADVAEERWIQGWGDTGNVIDSLAAAHGFRPKVACRSSDYRFMSALVGAGVGVALVPTLALPNRSDVTTMTITPQPVRYVGAYLPTPPRRNQTADTLLDILRDHLAARPSKDGPLRDAAQGRTEPNSDGPSSAQESDKIVRNQ